MRVFMAGNMHDGCPVSSSFLIAEWNNADNRLPIHILALDSRSEQEGSASHLWQMDLERPDELPNCQTCVKYYAKCIDLP